MLPLTHQLVRKMPVRQASFCKHKDVERPKSQILLPQMLYKPNLTDNPFRYSGDELARSLF